MADNDELGMECVNDVKQLEAEIEFNNARHREIIDLKDEIITKLEAKVAAADKLVVAVLGMFGPRVNNEMFAKAMEDTAKAIEGYKSAGRSD